jgi:hypothetical protein
MKRILKADYHRNGVGGNGFFVALFEDDDGSTKFGVFFPDQDNSGKSIPSMNTAVFDLDLLKKKKIKMSEGNACRGDYYADLLTLVADHVHAEFDALISAATKAP